ncbi:heterokaryon incompatibility protein-domain-containing protein [Exophiala viscosa]|uniref:heterokaryon incompatibility protein-domain-containing protein n=1 Tax=Exophiala viscosa TaxID=2486360 RepID=UPI00219202ED|nr:heterokaryon incompatibility protein-domain-containing protein [Exophiala viscosa]
MKRTYPSFIEGELLRSGGPKQPRRGPKGGLPSYELRCLPATTDCQQWLDSFCDPCSEIDLDAIFALEAHGIPHKGRPVSSHRTTLTSGCRLCHMVKSILDVDVREHEYDILHKRPLKGWHFRVFSCVKALRLRRYREVFERDVVLAVTAGEPMSTSSDSLPWINGSLLRGYITPTYSDRPFTNAAGKVELCGNAVDQNEANFSLFRSWLEQDNFDQREGNSAFHCQVIDCDKLEIIQHNPATRYLALSYVWGKPDNADTPETNLLVHAPQTVKDAVQVTVRLGERYLWVDRYCIPEHKDKKHFHITNMNLIYAGAFATIIAANPGVSDSVHLGIYGVSRARNLRPKLQQNGRTYVSSLAHLSYHLANSAWATRGWTYQEFMLSSRCLFFTADQVYYASMNTLQRESLLQYQRTRGRGIHQTLGPSLLKLNSQMHCDSYGEMGANSSYRSHLSQFTRRHLTYDLDILDAFRGVLGQLAKRSFYGMPVIPYPRCCVDLLYRKDFLDSYFSGCLCWTADMTEKENYARRTHFPSWSWASVSRVKQAFVDLSMCSLHAEYGIEQSDGHVLRLKPLAEKYKKMRQPIPEQTPFLHITSYLIHVDLEWNGDHRYSRVRRSQGFEGEGSHTYQCLENSGVYIDSQERLSLMIASRVLRVPALFLGATSDRGFNYFLLLEHQTSSSRRIGLLEVQGPIADQLVWHDLRHLMPRATIRLE